MQIPIRFHSNIFQGLFIAFFLSNQFLFHSPQLGILLLIAFVAVNADVIGMLLFGKESIMVRFGLGCLVLLSFLIILLTIAYYVFFIPKELVVILILLTGPLLQTLHTKQEKRNLNEKKHLPTFLTFGLIGFLCLFLLISFQQSAITEAVRSAWERLDPTILLIMGFVLLLTLALAFAGKNKTLALAATSMCLFVFISLALFVFPLGYGFDSFIHQATERYLAQFGTISPKPFYYIGQYALVLFIHHGFFLSVDTVDTFLVPILTALLIPSAWYGAATHITSNKRLALMTLTGLFLIPLSSFIVTTPQALANLWTLLLILACVPFLFGSSRPHLIPLGVIALATLCIHPIAGLPAILFFTFVVTDPERVSKKWKTISQILFSGLVIVTSLILPLSFLLNAWLHKQPISVHWDALSPIHLFSGLNLALFFENRFNPLLDFVYLYAHNAFLLLLIVAICGWWIYRHDLDHRVRILFWMVVALTINYFIMKNVIDLTFLINYERSNFADRLVPLISFFLVPFFILGLSHIYLNLHSRPKILSICFLFLLCGFSLSAFYLTYPRRDAYETSHGFNLSAADIAAVHLTEDWAQGQPYIALANQSVSSAAISEIGFRYYDSLFFYPIPTGEALYQQFLKMNEEPTADIARTALELVPKKDQVHLLFYIVDSYWWEAPKIIETAKNTATDWRAVGNGEVYVFRYEF